MKDWVVDTSTQPKRTYRLGHRQNYLPSPSEIRVMCLQIRATWSEEEANHRRCFSHETLKSMMLDSPNDDGIGQDLPGMRKI